MLLYVRKISIQGVLFRSEHPEPTDTIHHSEQKIVLQHTSIRYRYAVITDLR